MQLKPEEKQARKVRLMKLCFDYYCEHGLNDTGVIALAKACGTTQSLFYNYFENADDLILQSTAYCMAQLEKEFLKKVPADPDEVLPFFREVPYWLAKNHGKKYRFMYQVYSSPKFFEHGKAFFEGVNKRYAEYAERLEPMLGVGHEVIYTMSVIFVRAAVHFAMFGDEYNLKLQIDLLTKTYQSAREAVANAPTGCGDFENI